MSFTSHAASEPVVPPVGVEELWLDCAGSQELDIAVLRAPRHPDPR
jgi:hypothetical protein